MAPEAGGNLTLLPGFILLGFSEVPELQPTIFTLFFSLYAFVVLGNLSMLLLIKADPQLHSPMYFFLTHLALIDLCLSSAISPKALETFLLGRSHISFLGCFAQMYLHLALLISECLLLGVMAYDRYVAVCQPLLYAATVSKARCCSLMVLVYTLGFLSSLLHCALAGRLSFCQARSINHFFCELPTLLRLSCSDSRPNETFQAAQAGLYIMSSLLMILFSYTSILHTILQIPVARGRLKAFSTCTSHLIAVAGFYAPGVIAYLQPGQGRRWQGTKLVSAWYTILTPSLNPLIYSLRNEEVKGALRRMWVRKLGPHLARFGKGISAPWRE